MAGFFNRLGERKKCVGDRGDTAVDLAKLNNKIYAETNAIKAKYQTIGEYYYNRYSTIGPSLAVGEADILDVFEDVEIHQSNLAEAKQELERLSDKAEGSEKSGLCKIVDSKKIADEENLCGRVNAEKSLPDNVIEFRKRASLGNRICPGCDAPIEKGNKYCSQCGTKVDTP